MNLKKPKFWDYKKPNTLAYLLLPISFIIKFINSLKLKSKIKKSKIKTICVGNIYLGGTGKTSLSIKINEIFIKKNIKSCFVKKYYQDQVDEQKLLESRGKLFTSHKRLNAIDHAVSKGYEVAIMDDGLQDNSVKYDLSFVCFNNLNWIGNGLTIPSGPLRESIKNLKNYQNVFLNGNLENLENIKNYIFKINPKINLHIGKYVPLNIDDFNKEDKYLIFSGIGNHKTFISMLKNYEVIDSNCNWIHFNNQDNNKKTKEIFDKHKVLVKYCKVHPYGFRDNWCRMTIQPGLSEQEFFKELINE